MVNKTETDLFMIIVAKFIKVEIKYHHIDGFEIFITKKEKTSSMPKDAFQSNNAIDIKK